jgi:hypothetical protein
MGKLQFKSQFSEKITNVGSQLDHIWANVLGNECKFGATKAHWSYFHKSIYIAFKLPNTFAMYNKKN